MPEGRMEDEPQVVDDADGQQVGVARGHPVVHFDAARVGHRDRLDQDPAGDGEGKALATGCRLA